MANRCTTTQHRHPELVSGSIGPHTRSKRRQAQRYRKVVPVRVRLVDQIDLPLPVPVLELLLSRDRIGHVTEHLKMDEAIDLMAQGETRRRSAAMLPYPARQVGSHADVKRAVVLAREDIDARIALLPHGPESAAKWTLKQVQGDEIRLGSDISPNHRPDSHVRPRPQPRHAELVSASIVTQEQVLQ